MSHVMSTSIPSLLPSYSQNSHPVLSLRVSPTWLHFSSTQELLKRINTQDSSISNRVTILTVKWHIKISLGNSNIHLNFKTKDLNPWWINISNLLLSADALVSFQLTCLGSFLIPSLRICNPLSYLWVY